MDIRKAVITAAGEHHGSLPLQTIVDREGRIRTVLRLTLDDLTSAGIEQIAVVIRPGQSEPYRSAAGSLAGHLTFVEQPTPRGYGDAILQAAEFVSGDPFLHLVADHLYASRGDMSCAAQLCRIASQQACAVSAVQPTRENEIIYFGTVGGTPVPQLDGVYEVKSVVEKPTPTVAEQSLVVAGQRAGHYLCLFGMHVLTPAVLSLLAEAAEAAGPESTVDLSSSLNRLPAREKYLACELEGSRFNISYKYGLLIAQMAIALSGTDRDLILTELLSLLAARGGDDR